MSAYYSKLIRPLHRFFSVIVIFTIIFSTIPPTVFAIDEGSTTPTDGTTIVEGTTSATSTDPSSIDGGTASTTGSGTDGGVGNGQDGTNGVGGTQNGDTASTTTDGTPQTQGQNGAQGVEGSAGATPNDQVTPVEIISEGLLGDIDAPEAEETTGDIRRNGTNTLVETGIATAQGELSTDANSNDIRSELENSPGTDFDTYTFTATGTNDATISNDGVTRSTSGDNYARGRSTAKIHSGDAVATFNIANVINSNVVNSDGFVYLANKILEEGQSLNLTDSFFPDAAHERALSDTCSLLSCAAEDIVYNIFQTNNATITNNALVEATTGFNEARGDLSTEIKTGDAYAAANVMNVVNSNIIDSNYRLLTYNAIGDLDGDLVLPTKELFDAFFSRPNGTSQVETIEDIHVNVNNTNNAVADNNLDAYAETGKNVSTTAFDSTIVTGRGESESNVLNKVNENTYGGDSMYLLIRVHGSWSGDVVGLPDGLSWDWTPEGIVIYNTDAEISPSEFFGYDIDSYSANFSNNNTVALENNITLNAITGENDISGLVGTIETGNAFASANVMNIANTNIIGTNWTYAVINILGDFDGNVSFAKADISLAGMVSATKNPVGPDDTLTYTYTVSNPGNNTATNIVLDQTLQSARTNTNATTQSASVGTLAPGAQKQVTVTAKVNPDIAYGTTSVVAYASVTSDQGDTHVSDNQLMLSINAVKTQPATGGGTGSGSGTGGSGTGTTTGSGTGGTGGTGTTTGNGTGTTTNNGTGTSTTPVGGGGTVTPPPPQVSTGGGGGGGGGGGNVTKNKEIKRAETKKVIDPNSPPLLSVKKVAVNIGKSDVIKAGQSVDYKITVTNAGGKAYDVQVFDVLKNPIDAVMNEQSWDLNTVLPGESIDLTYTTEYNPSTPSGKYTNTASVKAYLKDGMKEKNEAPLKVKDAVYILKVQGVDLAVGNVMELAYFPGQNGKTSALISWETSKPSVSQLFYGIAGVASPYNPGVLNLGYQNSSFRFENEKVKHAMILNDLQGGRTYAYRVNSVSGKFKAVSREYTFTLPSIITQLTIPGVTPMVAGAATSAPAPTVLAPKPKYVPPAPKPAPKPTPVVAPVTPVAAPQQEKQSGVSGFVKSVFGFFR